VLVAFDYLVAGEFCIGPSHHSNFDSYFSNLLLGVNYNFVMDLPCQFDLVEASMACSLDLIELNQMNSCQRSHGYCLSLVNQTDLGVACWLRLSLLSLPLGLILRVWINVGHCYFTWKWDWLVVDFNDCCFKQEMAISIGIEP